jgi:predicted phosphoribosyltransferase
MTKRKYPDRRDAGRHLAELLVSYANRDDVIILALPRGGVPVAAEIANELQAPLDVFIVRKLGVPGQEELAMGAIALGGVAVFNENIINDFQIAEDAILSVINRETKELQRRELAYRGHRPFPSLKDKHIILVDDGVATGATLKVAIQALYQMNPLSLIVAVPVAETDLAEQLSLMVDEFCCPLRVSPLQAVGAWYEDFAQVEDAEVHLLLQAGYLPDNQSKNK